MFLRISSGFYKGLRISVPDSDLRPTEEKVRAAVFNILFSMIDFSDHSFADIFAGSGAVGFEALSRGFSSVLFVENNRKAVAAIKQNAALLKIEKSSYSISEGDTFSISPLLINGIVHDVIFIDPPYKMIDKIPHLINEIIEKNILSQKAIIIVESGDVFPLIIDNFTRTEKKYGNTYLTFYRKTDERN